MAYATSSIDVSECNNGTYSTIAICISIKCKCEAGCSNVSSVSNSVQEVTPPFVITVHTKLCSGNNSPATFASDRLCSGIIISLHNIGDHYITYCQSGGTGNSQCSTSSSG